MNSHRKLLAALVAGALAVIFLVGHLLWLGYREAILAAEAKTRDYASILEARLDATLRRADAEMQRVVRTTPLDAMRQDAASRYARLNEELQVGLINFPELRHVSIFDANGDGLYSSIDGSVRPNIADRSHFRTLRDNPGIGTVFSEVIVLRNTGRPAITFTRAIRDKQGVFRGVVVALIELDYFQKLVQSLNMGPKATIAIYRSDNFTQVLRWPEVKDKLNTALSPDSPTRKAVASGVRAMTFEFTSVMDGEARIYSYHVLPGYSFFISVGVARTEVLAEWRQRVLVTALLTLSLLAMLIGLLARLWHADAARARLVTIVNASTDAIISRDLKGRILSWNRGAEALFGYPESEVIGRDIQVIVPQNRHNEIWSDQGQGPAFQARLHDSVRVSKDGRLIDVSIGAAPIKDAMGNMEAIALIFRDITARKQAEATQASLEAQLRESQKMEAIGTLAGGVAHDFNNIVATIIGNADLAKDDAADNPAVMECIQEIRKAATRARDLVQQILSFSRRQPTQRKCIALAPVVHECARLLRATLPKRVSLDVYCEPDVPPVMADATQIQQSLINLATNAVYAISSGNGSVSIVLGTVMLDEAQARVSPQLRDLYARCPGLAVRISVSDDGCGMDAETQKRIFEPFFTTKPVNAGTGLGLSVVHGIVKAHEGAIVVNSELGKGSNFSIYLPVVAANVLTPENPVTRPTAIHHNNTGMRLLYLDDDDLLVSIGTRMLTRRGYHVASFTDQRKALEALRLDPAAFDLVLTDYNMPGMSGLDVARAVRAIRPSLPVIVTTGNIDDALRTQAADAGVWEMISKATWAEDLFAAVERIAKSDVPRQA